jgi:hypothetical protein
MSKKNEQLERYKLRLLLKRSSISNRRNCSKYWKGVTKAHYITMCELLWKFANAGYEVFTEVEGKDGKWRADIVAISGGVGQIVEVLHSESEEKFLSKKSYYPEQFILRPVKTKNFKIEEFDI